MTLDEYEKVLEEKRKASFQDGIVPLLGRVDQLVRELRQSNLPVLDRGRSRVGRRRRRRRPGALLGQGEQDGFEPAVGADTAVVEGDHGELVTVARQALVAGDSRVGFRPSSRRLFGSVFGVVVVERRGVVLRFGFNLSLGTSFEFFFFFFVVVIVFFSFAFLYLLI